MQQSSQATKQPSSQAAKQPCNQAAKQPSNQAATQPSSKATNKQLVSTAVRRFTGIKKTSYLLEAAHIFLNQATP